MNMGPANFLLGVIVGQVSGAWVYWRVRRRYDDRRFREFAARGSEAFVMTVVASAIFIPLRVHEWLTGPGSSWMVSVFMAACFGIGQAILFKGFPLRPPPSVSE